MTELVSDVAATAAKLAATVAQIRQLEQDAELFKSQLRAVLTPGAYTVGGRPALTITATRRFNPDQAVKTLPPELLAAVSRMTVDAKLAREILPPGLYQACSVEAGKPTVRLENQS